MRYKDNILIIDRHTNMVTNLPHMFIGFQNDHMSWNNLPVVPLWNTLEFC